MDQQPQHLPTQIIETFISIDAACRQLFSEIQNLSDDFGVFTLGLNDSPWRANSLAPPKHFSASQQARFWAATAMTCLDHRHDGDGRDTWQMAGVLVVPPAIIETANQINVAKTVFARLIQHYRQQQQKNSLDRLFRPESFERLAGQGQHTRYLLKRLNAHRVHLRHVTRHILCLPEYPKFLSLSWVRQRRSIQKLSVERCIQKLERLAGDTESSHLQIQMERLSQLTPAEQTRLRLVQTVAYPSIKAKAYWQDDSSQHLGYLSVPALIPAGVTTQLPAMTQINSEPPPARAQRRRDNRLPDTAICPSIRVYLAHGDEITAHEPTPGTKARG